MMDVADDRLRACLHGHMLDTNGLLALAAHSGQRFDLGRERALELDREVAVKLQEVPVRRARRSAHDVGR
ncbi:hypothetical protein [Sphingomonas sp.]|uniref:hypothetical protein n=1 Tax=Sphingomonas sp. TaxID=28214 RepID=UPI00344FBC87